MKNDCNRACVTKIYISLGEKFIVNDLSSPEETLMMKETETTREIEAKKIALDELTSEKYIYKQQEEALNMELRRE